MEKIRLGKTGLKVTKTGFGGIPIQTPPAETAIRLVQESIDLGINFLTPRACTPIAKSASGKPSPP